MEKNEWEQLIEEKIINQHYKFDALYLEEMSNVNILSDNFKYVIGDSYNNKFLKYFDDLLLKNDINNKMVKKLMKILFNATKLNWKDKENELKINHCMLCKKKWDYPLNHLLFNCKTKYNAIWMGWNYRIF